MKSKLSPKEKLIQALLRDRRYKFRELQGITGLNKPQLHELLSELRRDGHQVVYNKLDRTFSLSKCPTPFRSPFDMSWLPVKGKLGLISDTHYCSVAERPDLVEKAYTRFENEGITTVIHAGDVMDGYGVFKGHNQEVKVVGGQAQAEYVVRHYPVRKGMKTFFISGNHDNKSFEKEGIDQCGLLTQGFLHHGKWVEGRKDLVYLGQYSRTLALPNEVTIQVLHPHGGSAYARSYPQQKRSREMKTDDRPSMQVSGHYHQWCWIVEDYTHMLSLPAFQDLTTFFERLGFPRQMGFCIMEYQLGFIRFEKVKVEMVALT